MADENLTGKVIVITGASSGFGKGTALELAKRGAYVVLAARRENLLDGVGAGVRIIGRAGIVRTNRCQQPRGRNAPCRSNNKHIWED